VENLEVLFAHVPALHRKILARDRRASVRQGFRHVIASRRLAATPGQSNTDRFRQVSEVPCESYRIDQFHAMGCANPSTAFAAE